MAKLKNQLIVYRKRKAAAFLLLKVFGAAALLCFVLGFIALAWFFKDLPRPEKFAEGIIAESSKIYDKSGEILLYEIAGAEKRTFVSFEKFPDHLKKAILTAEDRNFYEHRGVDLKAILRALIYDLKIGQPAQGASTISQQLIRSYFLTQHKTIKRKTREIVLTIELERRYDKDQIFEWYLNLIPFGGNLYGAQAASMVFFNKPVEEISLAEAAVLAAVIRAPSALSPYGSQKDKLLSIKDVILNNMAAAGYISQAEKEQAQKEKIVFAPKITEMKAPHFVMFVLDYLDNKYGRAYLERAGLKITTTLDYELQEYSQTLVKEKVEVLKIYNAHNGGLVALNPKNGELLAMVGSKDYFEEPYPEGCTPGRDCLFDPQVNITLRSRQPGSAFKPFVYYKAFEKGFRPETLIWDVKTEFNPNCPFDGSLEKDRYGLDCYHPRNYTETFIGLTDFRHSLAQSRNLTSVKVLYLAGVSESIGLARKLGISTLTAPQRYGLSLVLGGGEVKPLEMALAYSVLANDGIKNPLNFIKKIEGADGKIIEQPQPNSIKVLSPQIVRQINDILSDNEARAPMFGYNSLLYIPGYDVAVKTGTTQLNNDGWAVGYSPNIVCAVWVGNNNNESMTRPSITLAGPVFNGFMNYILPQLPKENFIEPAPLPEPERFMTDGLRPEERHSILYFVNQKDPQFANWEQSVLTLLGL